MTAATLALCLALQASYDRAAVAYVTAAAIEGAPEIARQINMEAVPSVSVHQLRAIAAQIDEECRK